MEAPASVEQANKLALRIAARVWAKWEADSQTVSEAEMLKEYIQFCPYVTRDMDLVAGALAGIEQATVSSMPELVDGPLQEDAAGGSEQLDDDEPDLFRKALRISIKAFSALEKKSRTMSEADLLKEYIRLCPYVENDADVVTAAIDRIERVERGEPLPELSASPPLSDPDTEEEEEEEAAEMTQPQEPAVTETEEPVVTKQEEQAEINPQEPAETKQEEQAVLEPSETTVRKPKEQAVSPQSTALCWVGFMLRIVLMDLPLIVLLLAYAGLDWLHHVHDQYLLPQLEDAYWSDERYPTEVTYYKRSCTVQDMTTTKGSDLFLPLDATPEEAYQHQLLHGFTVFKNVLSAETATNLRNFVVSRNYNLTDDESIYVIENDNRYSFGLGTEEPSVTKVMMELANNEHLRPALDKVLGPNAALIEMTAITSTFGAKAQYWHDDVIAQGSAVNFARTFGPSYSIFVQLQNTTKQMGATEACPGTHYCSAGDMPKWCNKHGFQLVGEEGYWGIGDAMLMNMNSWHRGAAHVDPDGLDRVMLILTFVPKPTERAESRQMSQGITFSLRWDMWGHTLDDLAHADTAMRQPWATLRALGLYKPSQAEWGIDYISGGSMRMANNDNGFKMDELDEFVEEGGFKWLPGFLQAEVVGEDNWYEFYTKTFLLCEDFVGKACLVGLATYAFIFLAASVLPRKIDRLATLARAFGRLLLFISCAFLCFEGAKRRVDQTGWAADIKAHRRYNSTTPTEIMFAEPRKGPTTFPTRYDVLVETRYGSRQLHMYNDFINGHPGNRHFRDLLVDTARTYSEYPFEFQEASAAYLVGAVVSEYGRFLKQGPNGVWFWMDFDSAVAFIKRELTLACSELLSELAREIRFMMSDLKYGVERDTAMSIQDIALYLQDLERKILTISKPAPKEPPRLVKQWSSKSAAQREPSFLFKLPAYNSVKDKLHHRHPRDVPKAPPPREPFQGAWLSEGDTAEGVVDGYWFQGTITFVSALGDYSMIYLDGDFNTVDSYSIRPFVPYHEGEKLQVLIGETYYAAKIKQQMEDGSYHAVLDHNDGLLVGLGPGSFRRPLGRRKKRPVYKPAY